MAKTPEQIFVEEKRENIAKSAEDKKLQELSRQWLLDSSGYRYSYNFTWLGRPIIQYPQDIVAMQEIIWQVQPELIIETGIAHGGSLILYASVLELIGRGEVLGIDIDIRSHNREAIEAHPLAKRISMLEGSSIEPGIVDSVRTAAQGKTPVLVVLDSNHSHEHVAAELELYSPLVTKGIYLVVFDTVVEDLPAGFAHGRPWDKGNNPKTAVWQFLKSNERFVIDKEMEHKLLVTVAPDGYLKCIKE